MSSSIRPPGGSAPGVGSIGPAQGTQGTTGPAQVEHSKGAAASGAAASSSAVQAGESAQAAHVASSPSANWIRRLEAGEVTRAEAIEGLVSHAVEQHGGASLSVARRMELEGVLRAALLEDPVLGRLLGGA